MKRIFVCVAMIASPMLAHSAVPQDEGRDRTLISSNYSSHEYVYKREVSFDEKTGKFVDQSFKDDYVIGAFLYQLPDGSCEMERIGLKSMRKIAGVDLPDFNVVRVSSSCNKEF